jgi:hypothetical protein
MSHGVGCGRMVWVVPTIGLGEREAVSVPGYNINILYIYIQHLFLNSIYISIIYVYIFYGG